MEAHVGAIRAEGARERVWLVEHDPTYTAGTSARAEDLRDAFTLDDYRALEDAGVAAWRVGVR